MGDLKFILGFVAGWIATTQEGRKAASELANGTAHFVKGALAKKAEPEEAD